MQYCDEYKSIILISVHGYSQSIIQHQTIKNLDFPHIWSHYFWANNWNCYTFCCESVCLKQPVTGACGTELLLGFVSRLFSLRSCTGRSAVNVGQSRLDTLCHTRTHVHSCAHTLYCAYTVPSTMLSSSQPSACVSVLAGLQRGREENPPTNKERWGARRSNRGERCWGRAGMQPWLSCRYSYPGVKQHPSKSHETVSNLAIIRSTQTQCVPAYGDINRLLRKANTRMICVAKIAAICNTRCWTNYSMPDDSTRLVMRGHFLIIIRLLMC